MGNFKIVFDGGAYIEMSCDGKNINSNIFPDEMLERLITELFRARNALFTCPDCGYKIYYNEFVSQDLDNE